MQINHSKQADVKPFFIFIQILVLIWTRFTWLQQDKRTWLQLIRMSWAMLWPKIHHWITISTFMIPLAHCLPIQSWFELQCQLRRRRPSGMLYLSCIKSALGTSAALHWDSFGSTTSPRTSTWQTERYGTSSPTCRLLSTTIEIKSSFFFGRGFPSLLEFFPSLYLIDSY